MCPLPGARQISDFPGHFLFFTVVFKYNNFFTVSGTVNKTFAFGFMNFAFPCLLLSCSDVTFAVYWVFNIKYLSVVSKGVVCILPPSSSSVAKLSLSVELLNFLLRKACWASLSNEAVLTL